MTQLIRPPKRCIISIDISCHPFQLILWSHGPFEYIWCHKNFSNVKFYTKIQNKKRGVKLSVKALFDQLLKKDCNRSCNYMHDTAVSVMHFAAIILNAGKGCIPLQQPPGPHNQHAWFPVHF